MSDEELVKLQEITFDEFLKASKDISRGFEIMAQTFMRYSEQCKEVADAIRRLNLPDDGDVADLLNAEESQ